MKQNIVYSLAIQSVTEDKLILSLVSYTSSVISRDMLRELQSLEIENNVSIPGVRRRDKETVFIRKRVNMNNILIQSWEFRY
jgi:hypothetical protein